jgi:serine phosphatase RsbU (regulator of sigma subunit)
MKPATMLLLKRWFVRLGFPALVFAVVIAPLIVGSIWMYRASAGAFQFQHDVRVAQNARDDVLKAYLETEADIRGYAATNDSYFAAQYYARYRSFGPLSAKLESSAQSLDIANGRELITRERVAYNGWIRNVATIIVHHPRSPPRYLLRVVDPAYAASIVGADKQLGVLFDDATMRSESDRQRILRQILIASVSLVVLAAAILAALLYSRALAKRRTLVQRALYAEEQRITGMLQLALTPEGLPTIRGITLHAMYVPAASERQVGGDWYEVLELLDGRIFLMIGDVAGHGLKAAVTMNRARQAILAAAVVEVEPAAILKRANRVLCAQSAGMVTAACCLFDPKTMHLTYATAGHPPPVVVPPASAPYFLANGGAPLGVVDALELESFSAMLGSGWMLMLYTDGLVEEQHDVTGGERRLLSATECYRSASDPSAAIFAAIISGGQPRDDVAIVTMRIELHRLSWSESFDIPMVDTPVERVAFNATLRVE